MLVRSAAGSSNNLLIGDSTNHCFSLKACRACIIPCHNVSKLYSKQVSSVFVIEFLSIRGQDGR